MKCPTCGQENAANASHCTACATPLSSPSPGVQTGHTSDGTAPASTYTPFLPKGVRLQNNSYAIGEVLGQGGFGITYKGGDLSLRRYVAIKEFFPMGCARQNATVHPAGTLSAADYAGVKAKFIEEARTLARFNDAGIVRVFGVFEENNTAYMVMEFLEGQTLSKKISEKKMLDEAEAVGIIEKVGKALGTVHEAGLLHRDLKPDNICITGDGRVVLIDFGTARAFASGKTMRHTTMLTPGYAPLEQYGQQARFGAYTDIYALAATLYHCLTGQIPPPATDRSTGVELKAPHLLNPRVSPALSQAIVWAMQIKATDRPQNVREFLRALTAGHQTATVAPSPAIAPPSSGGWGVPGGQNTPSVPASAEKWFHAIGGTQTGPMSRAAFQNLVKSGLIRADTMIWREGVGGWIPAAQSEWGLEIAQVPQRTGPHYDDGFTAPRPDTAFDTFMGSIPAWAWRTLWLGLFLLLAGRIGVGVVRYQNGGRDFGPELSAEVLQTPEATNLTEAKLQLGEGVFDPDSLAKKHDDYVGKVRYQDGDAGDLNLDVTSRDWLYRPEKWKFRFAPTDFGPTMAGQIQGELTSRLKRAGYDAWARGLSLQRQTRTQYSGTFEIYDATRKEATPGGTVSVSVTSFDGEGAPDTWSYSVE